MLIDRDNAGRTLSIWILMENPDIAIWDDLGGEMNMNDGRARVADKCL
jgi:hypothetical protein